MSLRIERREADLGAIPPNFQKAASVDAPDKMRMMAANGMLPLPPDQNLMLLYAISRNGNEQLVETVRMSISDMPADVLVPVITALGHDGVLDWLAEERKGEIKIVEAIVMNKQAHAKTVARVARYGDAKMVDIVATNQVRLLEEPLIIEQMYLNPNARVSTVDRIVDLARRNGVDLSGVPGLSDALNSDEDIFSGGADDEAFEAILQVEAKKVAAEEKARADAADLTRAEREELENELDVDEDELERKPLHAQMTNMSIAQKMRLAMVGSREAVHLLVRDPNKLVHMAAVRSPRVKFADAVKWAKNKSLPDGVIHYIANNRDWTSKYEVMVNLVNNPKTPLAETLSLLNHIRTNDLKQLARSRNVPMQVVRQAKNLYKKRSGRT